MANQNKKFQAVPAQELPPKQKKHFKRASKLEWITIAYMISVIIIMYLTAQSSQAMKAAWLEDILSILPSISFLVASKFYTRKPNAQFPFGYHRVFSIAFQLGAFALLSLGLYLLYDSVTALLKADRPSIGSIKIMGGHFWMGGVMIAALLWSAIPAVILGQKKLPLADELHNKILFTDAQTQKADWETAAAAIVGILGVGLGLWWADAAAACFISFSIIADGVKRFRGAIFDLIDQVPTTLENNKKHPLVDQVHDYFEGQDWVKEVRIRMREAGEIFFPAAFVFPSRQKTFWIN